MGNGIGRQGQRAGSQTGRRGRVHYEETLSKSLGDVSPVIKAFAAFVVVTLVVGFALPLVLGGSGIDVVGLAFLLVFLGGTAFLGYRAFQMQVDVRVTDAGVEIARTGNPLGSGTTVAVPFERIGRVQYSDPNAEPHIYVPRADHGADWFMVDADPDMQLDGTVGGRKPANVYSDGVRIERVDGPPVYVGSSRPVELAETIAAQAPRVRGAQPLSLGGSPR